MSSNLLTFAVVNLFISRAIIMLFNIFLGIVGGIFYLGSKGQYMEAKQHMLQSYFGRFVPLWVVGICFGLMMVVINLLLSALNILQVNKRQIVRLLLYSIVVTTVCSFVGVSFFFWE